MSRVQKLSEKHRLWKILTSRKRILGTTCLVYVVLVVEGFRGSGARNDFVSDFVLGIFPGAVPGPGAGFAARALGSALDFINFMRIGL